MRRERFSSHMTKKKTFLPQFPPNKAECQPRSGIYCDSLSVLALCLRPHVALLFHCDSRAMSVPVPPGGTHCLGMPSTEPPWLLVQNTGARLPEGGPKGPWGWGLGRGGGVSLLKCRVVGHVCRR